MLQLRFNHFHLHDGERGGSVKNMTSSFFLEMASSHMSLPLSLHKDKEVMWKVIEEEGLYYIYIVICYMS
jgi:hypothetical protein